MIELDHVTKVYGDKRAVDDVSFVVQPGVVTGFLGPNGAGKSTTMRMIVGLDAPTAGSVRVNDRSYRTFTAPLNEVGALLEARAIHTGRSAYHHLLAMAQTHGISRARVQEVIDLVGIASVARRRAGTFSLGMGQRLGIATALLGDPRTIILDEPANGLDPEGILWIRTLLKRLAAEGRTVFVSSHLMSEMALTAEHLVIVGRGRLIADTTVAEFVARASADSAVHVRSPSATTFAEVLRADGAQIDRTGIDTLNVHGMATERVGELASEHALTLYELTPQRASLEDAYLALTRDSVEYRPTTPEPMELVA
ncbi:ABC transporter ATP-binding protein [Solirubrobacter soli]|uniref:ABC transporter ATP-binding protein n=1 Tax=Solirubrobacter soli TaxID=363832 RepID=UPI0004223930|nr:ATP-binding cassette domain-containing protein [Solirubrobacter soli]